MKTLQTLYNKHPNLILWAALAVGMVTVLLVAARNIGFTASQWASLVTATVAFAWLCVCIISWEDGE